MAIRIQPHDEYGFTFAYDADTRRQGIEEKLIEISRNSEQIRADLLAVFAGEDGVMNAEEIEAAEQFRQSNMDIASQNDYRDVLFINMVLLGELLDEQRATLNATATAEVSAAPAAATAETEEAPEVVEEAAPAAEPVRIEEPMTMTISFDLSDEYGFTFRYAGDLDQASPIERLSYIGGYATDIKTSLTALLVGSDGAMSSEEIADLRTKVQSNLEYAYSNGRTDIQLLNNYVEEILDQQEAALNATASAEVSVAPVTATAEPAEDIAGPVSVEGDVISVTTANGLTFQLDYSHSDPLIGTDREYGFSLRVPNTPGVVNTRSVDSLGMDQVVDALRTNQIEILGAMSDILTTRVQQGDEDADIVIAADFDRVLRPLADQIEDYDGRIGEVIDAMTVVALRDATANFDTDTTSVTDTIGRNGQMQTIEVDRVHNDSTAIETRDAFLNELDTGIFNNALAILEDNGFLDEAPELQPDTGPAVAGFQTADIQITIDISIENNTFIVIGAEGVPNDTVGNMIRGALAKEAKGEDGEIDPERLQALEDLIRDTADRAGGDTYITNITEVAINQINVINLELEVVARAAEAEEAPEVVEETAPAREVEHWFYRGNSSDEIAALQQALGVDETYRARLGDGWADWADGLIGSRTEGVVWDYADAHSIDPNTMSLEDFTNHVRDNLTADATLAAEIEAAEPVVETIVEAAGRAAAEAAVETAEAAPEAAARTVDPRLISDDRVLDVDYLREANALIAEKGDSFPEQGLLHVIRSHTMFVQQIDGETVVTQVHAGNADQFGVSEALAGEHRESLTSTYVASANGGGTMYETDELADALDRYDGVVRDRGEHGEDLDSLEDALRSGDVESLSVTFTETGLVTIEGTTAEADADGISIQIPQELYDRIMEAASTRDAPAVEVAATASPPTPTG